MNQDYLEAVLTAANTVISSRRRPEIVHRARWVLADTVTVSLAGGQRPLAKALVRDDALTGSWRNAHRSSANPATLLTDGGGWTQSDRAAYVNASILCDLELDEGTRPTGHPAAHVLPAVLAASEALDKTIGMALDSLVIGYEVTAFLLESFKLTEGIHPHGHLGAIGAAAAVAHLRGVDPLPPSLIAATTQLVTTWGPCLDGSTARNTWTGHAAAAGLLAHRLAGAGWEGSTEVLRTAFDGIVARELTAPMPTPESPRILNGYFKFFSACALTHTSIEAALGLAPLKTADVSSVRVRTTANNLKVAGGSHGSPLARRFSIPFVVATALTQSKVDVRSIDDPDPETADLAKRISVEEDPKLTKMWPEAAPAEVEVVLNNGTSLRGYCDNAFGTPARPASETDLRNKSMVLLGDGGSVWDCLVNSPESELVSDVLQKVVNTEQSRAGTLRPNGGS